MLTPLVALAIASPFLWWARRTWNDTYDCTNGCPHRPHTKRAMRRYLKTTGRRWQCPHCGTRWHTIIRPHDHPLPDTIEWSDRL